MNLLTGFNLLVRRPDLAASIALDWIRWKPLARWLTTPFVLALGLGPLIFRRHLRAGWLLWEAGSGPLLSLSDAAANAVHTPSAHVARPRSRLMSMILAYSYLAAVAARVAADPLASASLRRGVG